MGISWWPACCPRLMQRRLQGVSLLEVRCRLPRQCSTGWAMMSILLVGCKLPCMASQPRQQAVIWRAPQAALTSCSADTVT